MHTFPCSKASQPLACFHGGTESSQTHITLAQFRQEPNMNMDINTGNTGNTTSTLTKLQLHALLMLYGAFHQLASFSGSTCNMVLDTKISIPGSQATRQPSGSCSLGLWVPNRLLGSWLGGARIIPIYGSIWRPHRHLHTLKVFASSGPGGRSQRSLMRQSFTTVYKNDPPSHFSVRKRLLLTHRGITWNTRQKGNQMSPETPSTRLQCYTALSEATLPSRNVSRRFLRRWEVYPGTHPPESMHTKPLNLDPSRPLDC